MTELQRFGFEAEKQVYEVEIASVPNDFDPRQSKGIKEDAIAKMEEVRQLIRFYTANAVTAFKDFGVAEIEEVTLKFGLKMGGKAGIPYITEGSAESNLQIEVKCKFINSPKP
ncbi:MAG TPA: CU044_2847 family protein [Leptolyngbyaceae cyanobacterium]